MSVLTQAAVHRFDLAAARRPIADPAERKTSV